MNRIWRCTAAFGLAFFIVGSDIAQADDLDSLNLQAIQLTKDGKLAEAVPLALRYAEGIKARLGSKHPYYAVALYNLATLYAGLGRYADAELLHKQALTIREKALGRLDPAVGDSLKALAVVYQSSGRNSEAELALKRSIAIKEKARGPGDADLGDSLNRLAAFYHARGKYVEAEPLYKRSLAIRETVRGPSDAETADTLNRLAAVYHALGRYGEAEPLYKRSLAIRENARGQSHVETGDTVSRLAALYRTLGRDGEAAPLYKRSLEIRETALGNDHRELIPMLQALAQIYRAETRFAEAEPLAKRMLAISEAAYGPDNPKVAVALNTLGALYHSSGRLSEAEPLYKRALAITETALGPNHPEAESMVSNLASLYDLLGRPSEAEPLFKRALAIGEKLGGNRTTYAIALNNLAAFYYAQRRFSESEPLYKQAIEATKRAFGPEHSQVGNCLSNLGALYYAQRRFAEAEPLLKQAITINSNALASDHLDAARPVNNLAGLYFAQGRWAEAASLWQRSTAVLERRTLRDASSPLLAGARKNDAEQADFQFRGLVRASYRLQSAQQDGGSALAAQMFEKAQWALGSQAAASLAKMAVRGAKGDPALAALVRERQDLVDEWQKRDGMRDAAAAQPSDKRDALAEKANLSRIAAIDNRITEIDGQISTDFPDYLTLASPAPSSVDTVQSQLRPDEALVFFLDTTEWKPAPEETLIWVVTRADLRWVRSELGTAALKREVEALRCGLDAAAWEGGDEGKCETLLHLARSDASTKSAAPLFDLARSHALYEALFGQAEDLIKGKHLLIVPSGALTRLPFQVLLTKPPAESGYKSAAWMVRDHALTVLPAVSSLKALRRVARASTATKPMIGFGNPLLDGRQVDPDYGDYFKVRAALAQEIQHCRETAATRTVSLRGLRRSVASIAIHGLADTALLKAQLPLPETADELCAVARDLGADLSEMRLGSRATEFEVKRLSASGILAQFRIVHFATHGVLAGQLNPDAEPGLILTPPANATEEDDGYLSASEIAALKLDADWVILSACNTAGGEAAGAEALSGLARAFFYAQARALLVSHWEVDSNAAVKLITSAVGEISRDPSIGRAEALRSAILSLIDKGEPEEAHPSYWAPFVVVGEGTAAQ